MIDKKGFNKIDRIGSFFFPKYKQIMLVFRGGLDSVKKRKANPLRNRFIFTCSN